MVDVSELHEILQEAAAEPPANDEGFHQEKTIQKLQTLYDQAPCMNDLQSALVGGMADDRKGKIAPAIDRVLEVVSAVKYSTEDVLVILQFGIRCSQAEDKQIRLRSTQLVALLLQNLPEIPDSIWDELVESMLIRVRDKIVAIRVQTVLVLKRLQQPELPDDVVTAALLRLAVVDTNKEVRVAAVESVALTQLSVGDLLIRVRDISFDVRCAVFRVFSQTHVKDICTALDRMYLLDQGLQDRHPSVVESCQAMVVHWLRQCHDNMLEFLEYLALDHPVCAVVVQFLLDKAAISDLPPIKSKALLGSTLTPTESFLWKEQCIHFKKDHEFVEDNCPTLPAYCDLLRHNAEATEKAAAVLVGRHLLQLGTALDFQDEVGRRLLINSLREWLGEWTFESQWIQDAVSLLAILCEEFEFIQYMTEITSDIYDAMQECESLSPTKRRAMSERLDAIDQRMDEADVPSQKMALNHTIVFWRVLNADDEDGDSKHTCIRQMLHSNDHGFCSETLQLLSVFYPALANLHLDLIVATIQSIFCSIVYGTSAIPLDEAAVYFLSIFPEKDAAHDALSLQCCVEILAIAELKNLPKRDKEALQKHWWTLLQSLEWTDRNGRLVVLLEEVGGAFKAADATKFKARMEQVIQSPPHLTDHDTQWAVASAKMNVVDFGDSEEVEVISSTSGNESEF
ncbi:hypothetical protein DYB30_005329 [Aphanomyces astaci]|uniref:Nuclear condensin complex subunit 3 C-terminal domain-containing protein n=1 Tax=Aphanomyces astaci TaxID=112090 RepID=A0A397AHF2_APHAT|nr:hypothetical protein DYB36_006194 [Aphanomyces astaci]RHY41781.1 hypothetical protein DYB34_005277 [Aphanomyces astaci]RHY56932.1 hypothetical protein DYB30_005329 [Aphanomyces astaci]RHY71445.1 hypothetical protein DYB38_006931 [Aphanomyces astaci]